MIKSNFLERYLRHLAVVAGILAALTITSYAAMAVPPQKSAQRAEISEATRIVVFWEDAFPTADTSAPSRAGLAGAFPGAVFVSTDGLSDALGSEQTRLLVLAFGSAFPEKQWNAIHQYLERGGNLLVLGGRPFTRAAYKDNGAWKLRPAIQAFARTLFLNDYQETPGSVAAKFMANDDFSFLKLPEFSWNRAWSATLRLTDEDLYKREGSAGTLDTRLDTLAWGVANGRRLAAPIVELDHLQNHFVGGRWILVACDLPGGFFASAVGRDVVAKLAKRAADGAEDFTVQPEWPVFVPGEPIQLTVHWQRFEKNFASSTASVNITVASENGNVSTQVFNASPADFPYTHQISLPPSANTGIESVMARLTIGGEVREVYRTGFWMRDEKMLRSGPRMKVAGDYFTLDDKPILVAGTTYMASDVQRQFFVRPNPWLWNRDMAEIHAGGMNMLRTGWWTAWDQIMKQSGVTREEALRTMEAYLMTARINGLAVQFTFFAFTPDVFGGENPYLDPEAIRRQKELILPFVERFKDVPYLAWDLINEPSFSNPNKAWQVRPNGDAHELAAWNAWLNKRYANHGAIAEAWRSIPVPEDASVPLPSEAEFSAGRAQYEAWPANNSLRAMDYQHFAQDAFRGWVEEITGAVRAAGSTQLVTVGEDEGGGGDRPSPAIFGDAVDFTTTHSWWASDALLWDSLVAKVPGKPMLVQETGVSHEVKIDGTGHRNIDEETSLLERKLAIAAGTGAGAIQWLWNINSLQRDDRETTIGAVRPDGTEKPEAALLRRFAEFAGVAGPHMAGAKLPQVAIVTSQAMQYSPLQNLAIEAQQKSVRAMHYLCGMPAYVITENQLTSDTGGLVGLPREQRPKLVVLPSAHALSEAAWSALMRYVNEGGTLLVTGSVERDEHWRATERFKALGAAASVESLLLRAAMQQIGDKALALSFAYDKQMAAEQLSFSDGKTFHVISHGQGRIFVVSEPIELAEGLEPAAELYLWALQQVGEEKPYSGQVGAGVLVRPVELADSVLYLIVSESENIEKISVCDRISGGEINLSIAPGRAELLVLNKKDGRVVERFAEHK